MVTYFNESQFQAPKATVVAYTADANGNLTVRKDAPAGVLLHDACGVNALAMAESNLSGRYENTMDLFARMAPVKRCDNLGRATIASIRAQAIADGFVVPANGFLGFNGNGLDEATWRQFLGYHTSRGAVVVTETNEGCNLFDTITTSHEDATLTGPNRLQRHFFGVYRANVQTTMPDQFPHVAALPHGYLTADGCNNLMNPVKNGARTRVIMGSVMLYYAYDTVRLSRPAAMVAIYPKPKAAAPAPSAPSPSSGAVATPTPTTNSTLRASIQGAIDALQKALTALGG